MDAEVYLDLDVVLVLDANGAVAAEPIGHELVHARYVARGIRRVPGEDVSGDLRRRGHASIVRGLSG